MNIKQMTFPWQQRGAATLLVSLVLLIAVTLAVFATARSTFMEQRISANDLRSKAAFEAAQAGLDDAMAYFNSSGGIDKDGNDVADTFTATALTDAGGRVVGQYQVAFCDRDQNPASIDCDDIGATCTTPPDLRRTLIVSCGWSDDGVAHRRMITVAQRSPAVANPPSNPLSSRGGVDVGGSATVTNYYNNLTIWTGRDLTSIGNAGKTFIRNPDVPTPSAETEPPGPPTNCGTSANYICTTDMNTLGPDVIANDTSISGLTSDQYFANYFAYTPDDYRDAKVTLEVDGSTSNDTGTGSLDEVVGEVIWVEGIESGGSKTATLTGGTEIGSRDNPVILILNGDMAGSGNVTIYGLVYVLGDASVAGNVTIYGSAVVDGVVGGTGSFDVIYDPVTLAGLNEMSKPASLVGTWRDW